MSQGMRTGQGFANGRKFDRYFIGDQTRYREARQMVNGSDHTGDIAALATKFETVLLAARPKALAIPAAQAVLPRHPAGGSRQTWPLRVPWLRPPPRRRTGLLHQTDAAAAQSALRPVRQPDTRQRHAGGPGQS